MAYNPDSALRESGSGRQLRYTSKKALERDINKYFADCKKDGRPLTMSGLACALNVSREMVVSYSHKEIFADTIRRARQEVQRYAEEQLFRTNGQVAGVIFNLKNNHGWVDRTESDVTNTHLHLHAVARASYSHADTLKDIHGGDYREMGTGSEKQIESHTGDSVASHEAPEHETVE